VGGFFCARTGGNGSFIPDICAFVPKNQTIVLRSKTFVPWNKTFVLRNKTFVPRNKTFVPWNETLREAHSNFPRKQVNNYFLILLYHFKYQHHGLYPQNR
jgi:hypothetical protein